MPYDGNAVILAGQATNRKCQGEGGWEEWEVGSSLALSTLIWIELSRRILVIKQVIIRGGNRTFGRKIICTVFREGPPPNTNTHTHTPPPPPHSYPSQTVQLFPCGRRQ